MVQITGATQHVARLDAIRSGTDAAVYQALYAAGQLIEIDAEISITAGSVSGKGHVPSRPGEPPNADTRLLDTSIVTEGDPSLLTVYVISQAPYSADLEYGTSRMAARPFMRPASERNHGKVLELVGAAVSLVVQRSRVA